MFKKTIVIFLLSLPFFTMAQPSSDWQLYVNKTKIASASLDSTASVRLSKNSKGDIKIFFSERDTSFKRTILIMNRQRNTLLQKEMKTSCKTASFPVSSLLSKTEAKPFTIYLIDIPADPAKAALVRVAPLAICDVSWIE